MLRFDLHENNNNAVQLPNPHDPIFQLEAQLDQITRPKQRLALLYNDAKNYEMGKITPHSAWYEKRLPILQEYAALDWLALGEHLGAQTHCQAIHTWLHLLGRHPVVCPLGTLNSHQAAYPLRPLGDKEVRPLADVSSDDGTFDVFLFCRTLSKIDYLWHTTLPSQLSNVKPAVKTLLTYFEVQHT